MKIIQAKQVSTFPCIAVASFGSNGVVVAEIVLQLTGIDVVESIHCCIQLRYAVHDRTMLVHPTECADVVS